MQFNYGYCDKPDCEYCTQVKAANRGAVEPPLAASQAELKAAKDDVEHSIEVAVLQEAAARADSVFNVLQGLGKRVDAAVSGLVHGVSVLGIVKSPKAADPDGTVYIVDPTPTASNVFNGHANEVASKAAGTWTFQAAHDKETHLVEADNMMWTWSTTTVPPQWVKVGSTGNAEKVNEAIHKATDKPAPGDNDEFAIADATDTVTPFSLKKLTWANLKTHALDGIGKWWVGRQDCAASDVGDTDLFLLASGDGSLTNKLTWANLKGAIRAWISSASVNAPIDPHDRIAVIGQGSGNLFHNTFAEARDWFFKSLAANPTIGGDALNIPMIDTGTAGSIVQVPFAELRRALFSKLPDWVHSLTNLPGPAGELNGNGEFFVRGSDNNTYKTRVKDIKDFVLAGMPYRKKLISDGGGEDSMIFDISDYSGDPKMISIKGQVMATGTDNFRPSLWIKTNAGYINMETEFPARSIISTYGSGDGTHASDYTNGYDHRCYLNDPLNNSMSCKAGRPVYLDLGFYFETGRWSGFGWSVNYIGGEGSQVIGRGFCHGEIDASKITHIGVKCDTQGTGAFRNLYGEMNITVE